MITQLSYGVVLGLTLFIIVCFIVLAAVTPKAVGDYKIFVRLKNTKQGTASDSLTSMLERLSTLSRRIEINDLLNKIKNEAQKTAVGKGGQSLHAQTVLQWIDKFDVERHIEDLKKTKVSAQIRYDAKRKDFKLLIPAKEN